MESDIWAKITRYCAYQERCESEVKTKLCSLGLMACTQIEPYLERLRQEGYVEQARYAKAYGRGKFRNNQWGRLKIKAGLRAKGLSEEEIAWALQEIEPQAYRDVCAQVVSLKGIKVAISRGFEQALVFELDKDSGQKK